jgi:integration host factor subunit beta
MQKSPFMDKLIPSLATRFPDLTKDDISLAIATIVDAMSERLISGGRIELRGFGTFKLNAQVVSPFKKLPCEKNRQVTKRPAIVFKPGLDIRERVNNAA